MWFLQGKMLITVSIALVFYVIGLFVMSKTGIAAKAFKPYSIIINLIVLYKSSREICVFYLVYVLLTYVFIRLMPKLKRFRKPIFICLIVLYISPLLLYRSFDVSFVFGKVFLLLGFSYNMLKAVDALFYAYYTDETIKFLDYANFILFFPVFTAGPIFRYRDFVPAFNSIKPLTADGLEYGIKRFIIGMFKKVVLVVVFTRIMDRVLLIKQQNTLVSLGVIALSYLLLYIDMSGYSDMAVGVGALASMKVPENFKKPWTAASFTQFWRKWHVTLSDWIREHILVVVKGKKLNKYQSALIGLITMIVMSLWHEFTLITLISGIYMGLFLVIENIFSLSTFNVRKEKKSKYIARCALVNFFFAVNALLFYLEPDNVISVLKGLVIWS